MVNQTGLPSNPLSLLGIKILEPAQFLITKLPHLKPKRRFSTAATRSSNCSRTTNRRFYEVYFSSIPPEIKIPARFARDRRRFPGEFFLRHGGPSCWMFKTGAFPLKRRSMNSAGLNDRRNPLSQNTNTANLKHLSFQNSSSRSRTKR